MSKEERRKHREFVLGYATALATVYHINRSASVVSEAARNIGLTLTELRRFDATEFDIRMLKEAGIPSRHPPGTLTKKATGQDSERKP